MHCLLTVTDNDGNKALSQLTITGIEDTESGGSATLTIESLTTQNEYETWESVSILSELWKLELQLMKTYEAFK